jgi:hypothetical protein
MKTSPELQTSYRLFHAKKAWGYARLEAGIKTPFRSDGQAVRSTGGFFATDSGAEKQ